MGVNKLITIHSTITVRVRCNLIGTKRYRTIVGYKKIGPGKAAVIYYGCK